ncbi:hypothetical protein MRX96_043013 [Rhipicephalus microplus]
MQERGCVEYVGSRLGLLGWAKMLTHSYRDKEGGQHVTNFFHRIKDQAKGLIRNLSWMDSNSKEMTWVDNTFVTNLVNASKVFQRLRNQKHFADVYNIRMVPRYGRELYLYLPNSMAIALVTLSPPMYYEDATLAIKYGAIGSFAARQMARAFDEIGVTVDDTGKRPSLAWGRGGRNIREKGKLPSFRPWRGDYRALIDFKVLHLEMFTDLQIFFLAYCYSICSKRPQTMRDECNVPAMNSPIFAEVFHCPVKSPMNPPNKCTFFDR